jgi:outer membrane protein OmpA-like peptidoglycan-associated protein
MAQNPELAVYVKSYRFKGKDDYNMDLSDRRAKSTIDYIVSKVNPLKISGKGFGESELK